MKKIICIFLATAIVLTACKQTKKVETENNKSNAATYTTVSGEALGTFYNIKYSDNVILKTQIDSVLNDFCKSLSAYDKTSLISKINQNVDVAVDDTLFINVFNRARYFYDITNGAFDISASPLFSAWGFGFGNKEKITEHLIDSLKTFCGMDKISIKNGKIIKTDKRVNINANALAKGYAVDIVANFLEQKGIKNIMVEIGGEIMARGVNPNGIKWHIGIDTPFDGNMQPGEDIKKVIEITDCAIATSGNYRQFYVENGKKYAHTIDPRTGYPVQHNLLSATVLASNCMDADAVATSLMVMGIEKAKQFIAAHSEYKVYLIYEENGEYKEYSTLN